LAVDRMGACVVTGLVRSTFLAFSVLSECSAVSNETASHHIPGAGECLRQRRSSPINIVPHTAIPRDNDYIRLNYSTWHSAALEVNASQAAWPHNHTTTDGQLPGINLHFTGKGGGIIQVGHSYDDLDEYVLRSIIVRMPSEHTFLQRRLPVEVQLWHEPAIEKDLHELQEERQRVKEMMVALKRKLKEWQDEVQRVRDIDSVGEPFPNIQTEKDWITSARGKADKTGQAMLREMSRLRSQMQLVDEKTADLVDVLQRPHSARVVILSLLFRTSDEQTVPQPEAMQFFRWIAGAVANLTAPSSKSQAPETFDFSNLPYRGVKDVEGSVIHKVFNYKGSFTEPPCTPAVQWFVASEPLTVEVQDVLQLVSASDPKIASNDCDAEQCLIERAGLGEKVWWHGAIETAAQAESIPPDRDIYSVHLSTVSFQSPSSQLSIHRVTNLPWSYIEFYCSIFLICAIFMLVTTCAMCSQKCCR